MAFVVACGPNDDAEPTATSTPQPTATPASGPHAGVAGLGDPYFPELGNGGYDVQHYDLDLRYDPASGHLDGVATIDAVVLHELSRFNLDFRGMQVISVVVDGVEASFSRDGAELIVEPDEPLPDGGEMRIVVRYGGTPEPLESVFGPRIGWLRTVDGTTVIAEPNGASSWYPANDHPRDKATYTISMTVPDELEVIANGLLQETIEHDDDTTTWSYRHDSPMASYLATVTIGDLVLEEDGQVAGVTIRNAFASSLADSAAPKFENTDEMLEFFIDLFGPYPYETYGVAVVEIDLGGLALETQTISTFDRAFGLPNADVQAVAAHELAHQWFGNSVTLDTWKDIWLNEGFATYAQYLWIEELTGRPVAELMRDLYSRRGPTLEFVKPGDPGPSDLFSGSVYVRGAFTLHALRVEVGDEAFFEILRAWPERYAGETASTEDFIALAEEISGADLESVFDPWLFGETMPPLPVP